jgi:hypothetical protein
MKQSNQCAVSFLHEQCAGCPYQNQCKPKIFKKVAKTVTSKAAHERAKIQHLYKTRQGIPGIYAQKFGDILQNMNFSRHYRNRGKFIYGFDPNIYYI